MSGINGDYASLAEAVGEAPPRTGITGGEFEEMLHDCGGDYDEAMSQMRHVDHVQMRDAAAWHREHTDSLDNVSDEALMAEAETRGLLDDR